MPSEYGGHGGDFRHDMVVIDQQAKHGVDGFAASLHNTIILPYLVRHGTEEQKKRWLPRLASGELVGAIAMTEPGAGSDLQGVKTTAVKSGNGYVVNGSKTFITNGQHAGLVILAAKTDPAAGAKGVSLFLVDTSLPGIAKGKNLEKIGLHSQDT
ncbi:MAG: acyl-CoA dehydrogenase family protein, partial [Novosphingobium sp.]